MYSSGKQVRCESLLHCSAMSGASLVSAGLVGWSSCRVKHFSNTEYRFPCGEKLFRYTRDEGNFFPLGPSVGKLTEMWDEGMNIC
jgi:hypothetical protein